MLICLVAKVNCVEMVFDSSNRAVKQMSNLTVGSSSNPQRQALTYALSSAALIFQEVLLKSALPLCVFVWG